MARILLLIILGGSSLACSTTRTGGFRFTGDGMEDAFQKWRRNAPPGTRKIIETLERDETVLIHIVRGRVENRSARGAASGFASSQLMRRQCLLHPPADNIKPARNFDVIYDQGLQRESEARYSLPSPTEALLHHEIIGHLVPILLDPDMAKKSEDELEDEAIRRENEYRRHVGLPLVPLRVPQE